MKIKVGGDKKIYLAIFPFLILIFISSLMLRNYKNIPAVKTIIPVRTTLLSSVETSGTVFAKESIPVSAKVSGRIKEIYIKDNEYVEKGKLLLEIDDEQLQSQILQAETQVLTAKSSLSRLKGTTRDSTIESANSNLAQAEIALTEAERNLKSMKKLFEAGAIAKEQLLQAENQYNKAKIAYNSAKKQLSYAKNQVNKEEIRSAELQLQQAEKNLANLKQQLKELKIYSPISGRISFAGSLGPLSSYQKTNLEKGAIVSSGQILFTITNTDKLQVKAYVDEISIKDIKIGDICEITGEQIEGEKLRGYVSEISGSTVEQGGLNTVEVTINLQDRCENLRIGSLVDVEIITNLKRNALTIPNKAVINKGGENYCYVVERHSKPKAHLRKIKLGMQDGELVEILEGIKEGEQIIITNLEKIKDGKLVRVE